MKRLTAALTLAMSLAAAQPTLGRDPYREDPNVDRPQPVAWTPEPAPVAPTPGIYLVTDTYIGDSVTRAGAITTYSTETVHETTGSYARVLESVGTGGSSAYDGAAFNGRAALTDGRAVAGTYYENYIRSDGGFVPVSVVFFQDDSEIARAIAAAQSQASAPLTPDPLPVVVPAVIPSRPPTGASAPFVDREDPSPVAPAPSSVRASVLLPDRSIEVLRGRRTTLSFEGDDVRAWRFLSGEGVSLGALAGTRGDPFVARWDRLAPPQSMWVVRFLVDYADGTSHEHVFRVAVRAPGLVE
jgi:hypothetical protein